MESFGYLPQESMDFTAMAWGLGAARTVVSSHGKREVTSSLAGDGRIANRAQPRGTSQIFDTGVESL